MTTLQYNHEAMAAWNEKRAKAEKEGIEKFWRLKETFREFAKVQSGEIGLAEYWKRQSK